MIEQSILDDYLLWNPDVAQAVLRGETTAENHYKRYAEKEGRLTSKTVNDLERPTDAVDVIMVVKNREASLQTIRSLLAQVGITVLVHAVDPGQLISEADFDNPPNLYLHRRGQGDTDLEWIHHTIPYLRCPYLAFAVEGQFSQRNRLYMSLLIMQLGAEVYCGGIAPSPPPMFSNGTHLPNLLSPKSRDIHETLLFGCTAMRRHVYLDSGGVGAWGVSENHQWMEFCARLFSEKRLIQLSGHPLVSVVGVLPDPEVISDKESAIHRSFTGYQLFGSTDSMFEYGKNWTHRSPVQADVVVTVRDNHHYADEAIQSILAQKQARTYIHIVDDASEETDTIKYLEEKWSKRPFIYTYFNSERLGPYQTLNQLYPYLRTDYMVVQDADDLSLKTRVWEAVNTLELSGADLFYSDVTPFSSSPSMMADHNQPRPCYASLVMRKAAFRTLGGHVGLPEIFYGLDDNFYARAQAARLSIFQSRKRLLLKRLHPLMIDLNGRSSFDRIRLQKWEKHHAPLFAHPSMTGGLGRTSDVLVPLNQTKFQRPNY